MMRIDDAVVTVMVDGADQVSLADAIGVFVFYFDNGVRVFGAEMSMYMQIHNAGQREQYECRDNNPLFVRI